MSERPERMSDAKTIQAAIDYWNDRTPDVTELGEEYLIVLKDAAQKYITPPRRNSR